MCEQEQYGIDLWFRDVCFIELIRGTTHLHRFSCNSQGCSWQTVIEMSGIDMSSWTIHFGCCRFCQLQTLQYACASAKIGLPWIQGLVIIYLAGLWMSKRLPQVSSICLWKGLRTSSYLQGLLETQRSALAGNYCPQLWLTSAPVLPKRGCQIEGIDHL